ncbi:MAG: methyltransferase domain-containing protein [Candidatus Omnitrophica bacterium]|nr:methyltransferase domain-containing protein [Candidatus Omnitrophota bacterium]
MEITDKEFWADYWGNIKIPILVDYGLKNDRIIAETIKKYVPVATRGEWAIEVGCAPGKWLIFLNKELQYKVAGFEYVEAAAEKTVENLLSQSIKKDQFKVVKGDFIRDAMEEKYPLILSLGFIEHFTDVDAILLKHLEGMAEGGYLVLGVPNFRGVNFYIQRIVDRFLEHKMLPNHNLKAMDLSKFEEFARAHQLTPLFIGYAGGFERGLFDLNAITNVPLRIIMKVVVRILCFLFNNTRNSFFNGYILAVMRK